MKIIFGHGNRVLLKYSALEIRLSESQLGAYSRYTHVLPHEKIGCKMKAKKRNSFAHLATRDFFISMWADFLRIPHVYRLHLISH